MSIRGARTAFHPAGAPHGEGQVSPAKLRQLIASDSPSTPQEKGIDVALALDFTAMAIRGE